MELEKFKVKVSDPIVESDEVVVESDCGDGENNEEKVSLTHTDKWTDGKELPVVVIEDQSNLIISMYYFVLFVFWGAGEFLVISFALMLL